MVKETKHSQVRLFPDSLWESVVHCEWTPLLISGADVYFPGRTSSIRSIIKKYYYVLLIKNFYVISSIVVMIGISHGQG